MGIERSTEAEDVDPRVLGEAEEGALPQPLHPEREEEISEGDARVAVLHAMLEGKSGPVAIRKCTGLPIPLIERILNSPEIAEAFTAAKRDLTQSAMDRLTDGVHVNLRILETLRTNQDPRVRMEAARDLLNRTPGMAPGAKLDVTASEYMKKAARYLKLPEDDASSPD